MNEQIIDAGILERYAPIDKDYADQLLQKELNDSNVRLVVLDDDPTGVQTVHDVSVYTGWSVEDMERGFEEKERLFYVLTNSRGLTEAETAAVHKEIAANTAKAAANSNHRFIIMSRGDSTLRGHYPLETRILKEELEKNGSPVLDGEIICPFFKEGGRFTINDVHYVRYGDELVPAGQTEFAHDKTFGYKSSNIREYIEEKTLGEYPADSVTSIGLESLRNMDIDGITKQLMAVEGFGKVVVNAIDYADLTVFGVAFYRALRCGKNFMFRTAASLVKVLGGITDQPLLTRRDMIKTDTDNGGIVVVGSHTRKTTEQLNELLTLAGVEGVEFNSDIVLKGEDAFKCEVTRVVSRSEQIIRSGRTAVCYTSRKLLALPNDTPEEALIRSVRISDGVQSLVGQLGITPAFVIAKGGITSSDVGTKALGVRKARVLGQIRLGVPVWETGPESRFPQIPYVIFPGNVGDKNTLREAVEILI